MLRKWSGGNSAASFLLECALKCLLRLLARTTVVAKFYSPSLIRWFLSLEKSRLSMTRIDDFMVTRGYEKPNRSIEDGYVVIGMLERWDLGIRLHHF